MYVVLFVLALVALAVAALVVVMVVVRHRRSQEDMLLSTLAVAAERLMPLAPAAEAFAGERGWMIEYRARRLAGLLRSGSTLPDALYHTPGLVSRHALATIRVGQDAGALATALHDVVESNRLHRPLWDQMMGRVLYLCALLLFAFLVALFMTLRIAPQFQMIFAEFDAELPPITQAVLGTSSFLAATYLVWGLPLLLILLFALLLASAHYVTGTRVTIPLLGGLTRRLDTAAILDALALAAERNMAFRPELEILARWYPGRGARERLAAVLCDLDLGADWCGSLARHGLIGQAERSVLQAAQRVGNLPWALREMADSSRRRLQYRLHAMLQMLFPLVILSFGVLVFAYVAGYFMPMVTLIQHLT